MNVAATISDAIEKCPISSHIRHVQQKICSQISHPVTTCKAHTIVYENVKNARNVTCLLIWRITCYAEKIERTVA